MTPEMQAALDSLGKSIDSATFRVTTDVEAFKAQIAALQAQVDAGNNDPVVLATIADLQHKVDILDTTSPTTADSAKPKTADHAAQHGGKHPKP